MIANAIFILFNKLRIQEKLQGAALVQVANDYANIAQFIPTVFENIDFNY